MTVAAPPPLRVLVVTHNYPRFAGDHAGSFIARLSSSMVARGHAVRVIAPHAPGLARAEEVDGVAVRRFRYGPDALETVAYRGDLHRRRTLDPRAAVGIPLMLMAFAFAVRRQIRQFRPDVVHAHWWFPGGAIAVVAAGRATPVVVTCHGSDVRLLDRGGALGALGRRTLRRAHAVTCVSAFLARDVAAAVPGLGAVPETIYMPLETEPFESAAGVPRVQPPRVLFVGNLVTNKGVDMLLAAFAMLRREGVACSLRIVGAGPEESALRALSARLGIADDVEWMGIVPHDRIAREYAAATVLVLPSRGDGEGLGLVLAEALLTGTAVVGSPAGGIPEVVADEVTGLIARDGDATHLARQIGRLVTDAALRQRLTAQGAAHVRARFAPDAAATAFHAVYSRLVERPSAG